MSAAPRHDPGVELARRLRLACEAHQVELGAHLSNVARHTRRLGRAIGLSAERLHELRWAAPLHDLGKIAISRELLQRPGSLSPAEMEEVKRHTVVGHHILADSAWPVIRCAARIARSHHECWDGSGYPDGLAGEEIPLEARLCAIADVFDALRSPRSYKGAWSLAATVAEIRRLSGTKFDPRLVDAFLDQLPQPRRHAA